MGPPRIPPLMALVTPPVAAVVTTAATVATVETVSSLAPYPSRPLRPARRARCLAHPVMSRTQQQPRAAAYGRALLRAATYDRAHPRMAVCASTSPHRQHLREQQLTPPPPSLPQLPPWGEGDVGVAGVSCLQPVLPLPSAGSAVRGGERLWGEGEGKRGECERVAREILQSQQPPLLSLSLPLVLLWGGG
ncbi:unnamed protein product [Closterium sp. NIES-53]